MKKLITAYAFIEFGKEKSFPYFQKTKNECINSNREDHENKFYDPLKRGVIAKCKIEMDIPKFIRKLT